MNPLAVQDILPLNVYDRERSQMRKRALAARGLRRIQLNEICVIVFENRLTVQYQVQEMMRVERDDSPEHIALELSCFNLLIPGENELSATLLIHIPEYRQVENVLKSLHGITHQSIALDVGGSPVYAKFDVDEDKLTCESDVFYIRFPMTAEQAAAFRDLAVPVSLRASHERCSADVPISTELRASLIEDLAL